MSQFRVGDVVRCVNKTFGTVIEGEIRCWSTNWIFLNGCLWAIEIDLWDVSLVKAAPEPLPTEPETIWRDAYGYPWYVTSLGNLTPPSGLGVVRPNPIDYAPFTRLEPVSETAKRISDWIWEHRTDVGGTRNDEWRSLCRDLKADFGVTS